MIFLIDRKTSFGRFNYTAIDDIYENYTAEGFIMKEIVSSYII